jgi:hypothetical protein
VFHPETAEVALSLPAAFEDGAYVTFSTNLEERQFILLLKECAALQAAANLFLERLQDANLPLEDRTATDAALNAATLLLAVRAKLHEFMAESRFSADFFLDVLRQYACLWSAAHRLRPPSGANDANALERDVMLFNELIPARADFPGFRSHVKATFSVLTEQARRRIERAMAAPSIEQRLLERLAYVMEESLATKPWLAAYVLLFEAQANVSHTHYATVLKYLVRPKQIRDQQADPRERITVVANTHGTTGMDPSGIMRDLDRARANHFLRDIAHRGRYQIRRQLETWKVRPRNHSELLALCKAD